MFEYMNKQYQSLSDINGPLRAIVKDVNDPMRKGRVGVIVPRLMPYVDPNLKSKPKNVDKQISKDFLQNEEVAGLISEKVNVSPIVWVYPSRGLTGSSITPYVNDSVLVEFEDGDFKKGRLLPYTYPLADSSGALSSTIDTASDEFDPSKRPQIQEMFSFKDGSVMFYNENPGSRGFFIRTASGYEISIGENPTAQGIVLKTAGGYSVTIDELNKAITNVTPGGHKFTIADGGDDGGKMISTESSAGHKIVINDDDNKIEVATAGGQSVVLDDGAGTAEIKNSGGAKMTLSGPNIMMN